MLQKQNKFWNKKRVFITGADGFVGSNLTKTLLHEGAWVITFSRSGFKKNSLLHLEKLTKKVYKNVKGTVEDFSSLNRVIKKNEIDIIYHLAAQPLVEIGQESPLKTFEINIKGTWNILEAARQNNIKKIIVASTSHVYGNNPKLPFKEHYFPQPSRPYETSKASADLLAQSFADTYGLPVEIPRFTNLYGPGDFNFSRVIPKTIRDVLIGERPRVWDLGSVRDFLFIEDALNAFLLLAEIELPNNKRRRVTNFGSGKAIDVLELVKTILWVMKHDVSKLIIEKPPIDRDKEVLRQYVSISKAKRELSWKPQTSLKKGILKTVEWYKSNPKII